MVKPIRLDYCQYLLSMPLNYTLTHFADHCDCFSRDLSRGSSPPAIRLEGSQTALEASPIPKR